MDAAVQRFDARSRLNPRPSRTSLDVLCDDLFSDELSVIFVVPVDGEVAVSCAGVLDFEASINKLFCRVGSNREQFDLSYIVP